jgi:hypothetical protein
VHDAFVVHVLQAGGDLFGVVPYHALLEDAIGRLDSPDQTGEGGRGGEKREGKGEGKQASQGWMDGWMDGRKDRNNND